MIDLTACCIASVRGRCLGGLCGTEAELYECNNVVDLFYGDQQNRCEIQPCTLALASNAMHSSRPSEQSHPLSYNSPNQVEKNMDLPKLVICQFEPRSTAPRYSKQLFAF